MWVLIDNYDSFTYILHHYLLQCGSDCVVYRNDEITIEELEKLNPARIILSPGPETPLQAGITMDVVKHFHDKAPILGVCLGHQALGMYFGAQLIHAPHPMHGKTSEVSFTPHPIFEGLQNPFTVMRYHSLAVSNFEGTGLQAIAHSTDDNTIMALAHETYPCIGVQFHPESIGTANGLQILKNWAKMF
jgi:anthranilate synthase/aminodeoxychorismate synthase-like glutamine amidotransferase